MRGREQITRIRYCTDNRYDADGHEHDPYNIVEVDLAPGVADPTWSLHRTTFTSSSCGICGKSSIEAVHANACWSVAKDPVRVAPEILYSLPERLRERQKLFDSTGGLHAAGLFTAGGELLVVREDVGRHNALDKLAGALLRSGRSAGEGIVVLSSRISIELVQKAGMMGAVIVVGVSAPTARSCACARMWAGTTPWTRWSAGPCARAACRCAECCWR